MVLQFNRAMENIKKICKDKKDYIERHHKNAMRRHTNQEQIQFQIQAINLIQKQVITSNILCLLQSLQNVCRKNKRSAFTQLLHSPHSPSFSQPSNQLRLKLAQWKMRNFADSKQLSLKLEALRLIQAENRDTENFTQSVRLAEGQLQVPHCPSHFNELKLEKTFVHLNILDISEICPKVKQCPVAEEPVIQQHSIGFNRDQADVQVLRREIARKQEEMVDYSKRQEIEVKQLRQRLAARKQLAKQSLEESLTLERAEEILISKLIRENFDLEEKLEAAYELVSLIEQDKRCPLGRMVGTLRGRRYVNAELQKQNLAEI